jgi:nucleotide-binding universal stress UspA family protein
MLTIHTILHPTDFSERSDYAFCLSCSLAHDYGARLVLLHVIPPPVLVAGGDSVASSIIEDFHHQISDKLGRLQSRYPDVHVEHRLAQGDPVTEILRVAQDSKIDMVVMGTHGLTGLKRVVMGSVAEGVASSATCPVVIVRTPFPHG